MNHHRSFPTRTIVYLLDSFPVLSQTFVLQEILELQRQGLVIQVFSLFEPSAGELAHGDWLTQLSITYISRRAKARLLGMTVRRLFQTPRRLLRTALLTLLHHRPRAALSYLLDGVFVAEQITSQDMFHLHAHFAIGAASVAQIVHLLTDIPYSFTTHAYDIYLSNTFVLAYKMRMAHFVVTCSEYNRRYLQKQVSSRVGERIHCVYVGLNLKLFPPPTTSPTQPPLIMAVSRLVEKKGLLYLVQACGMLRDQGYDFTCRIVGEGPQRPTLEEKIHELCLDERVTLWGAATHEQAIAMYQEASVVSLPCIITGDGDRDGIPNALMEALYMRVPVVSTPISGIPELVVDEQSGLLVPPNDSAALASALARLLTDPILRARLARTGRTTVEEKFDVAKNAICLLQLMFEHR